MLSASKLVFQILAVFVLGGAVPGQGADRVPEAQARWVVYEGSTGPGQGKHVVLVSGDEEYRSEEALPMLARILAEHHGFRCTLLFSQDPETGLIDPENQRHIPGMENIATADLVVLFLRFRQLPDEDMKHLVDYVEAGKPIIGIRTSTHAFSYDDDSTSAYRHWGWRSKEWAGGFGKQILGETWRYHHGKHGGESTRGVIPEASTAHPVLRGVSDVWGPTDVYGVPDLPDDVTVLLEGSIRAGMEPGAPEVDDERNHPRHPVVWTRELAREGGAEQRVLCSTIGASVDFESHDLRRLFVNACYWCLGLEDALDGKARADPVGAYEPTMFGFGKYVRGVHVRDHAPR
jgi:hypothetical protein